MEHTPTFPPPWKAQGQANRPWLSSIVRRSETGMASPIVTVMATQDAEYIVQCVNAHDALVAALATAIANHPGPDQHLRGDTCNLCQQWQAARKLAGGS